FLASDSGRSQGQMKSEKEYYYGVGIYSVLHYDVPYLRGWLVGKGTYDSGNVMKAQTVSIAPSTPYQNRAGYHCAYNVCTGASPKGTPMICNHTRQASRKHKDCRPFLVIGRSAHSHRCLTTSKGTMKAVRVGNLHIPTKGHACPIFHLLHLATTYLDLLESFSSPSRYEVVEEPVRGTLPAARSRKGLGSDTPPPTKPQSQSQFLHVGTYEVRCTLPKSRNDIHNAMRVALVVLSGRVVSRQLAIPSPKDIAPHSLPTKRNPAVTDNSTVAINLLRLFSCLLDEFHYNVGTAGNVSSAFFFQSSIDPGGSFLSFSCPSRTHTSIGPQAPMRGLNWPTSPPPLNSIHWPTTAAFVFVFVWTVLYLVIHYRILTEFLTNKRDAFCKRINRGLSAQPALSHLDLVSLHKIILDPATFRLPKVSRVYEAQEYQTIRRSSIVIRPRLVGRKAAFARLTSDTEPLMKEMDTSPSLTEITISLHRSCRVRHVESQITNHDLRPNLPRESLFQASKPNSGSNLVPGNTKPRHSVARVNCYFCASPTDMRTTPHSLRRPALIRDSWDYLLCQQKVMVQPMLARAILRLQLDRESVIAFVLSTSHDLDSLEMAQTRSVAKIPSMIGRADDAPAKMATSQQVTSEYPSPWDPEEIVCATRLNALPRRETVPSTSRAGGQDASKRKSHITNTYMYIHTYRTKMKETLRLLILPVETRYLKLFFETGVVTSSSVISGYRLVLHSIHISNLSIRRLQLNQSQLGQFRQGFEESYAGRFFPETWETRCPHGPFVYTQKTKEQERDMGIRDGLGTNDRYEPRRVPTRCMKKKSPARE
ncbi:hypothetical protein ACRALDRAFT_207061, partial [Sodiomyces alcalophilus JCM 7366]|uniref:uncharacterized protein n=1 Tax=Sodiomyces alcalophilus JCM 7366 TaxID=591952 RepID=UPI0039B5DF0D